MMLLLHMYIPLELVVVGVERRDFGLETLADTDAPDQLLELAALLERSYGKYHQYRVD